MSLDVGLYIDEEELSYSEELSKMVHTSKKVFDYNVTHNLNMMAEAAGLYNVCWRPEEHMYNKASDILPVLEQGFSKLVNEPDKYKKYNPSNGWGTYENLTEFIAEYIKACREYPEAEIYVSR